jgi:hypothetical protein
MEHWNPLLVNLRAIRRDDEISWAERRHIDFSDSLTLDDLARMQDQRQYSFQVADDGSLFQLYYSYERGSVVLKLASLVFLKAPGDDEIGELERWWRVPWLRIDYDPKASRGPLHAMCHLHVSAYRDARIPVSVVPGPFQFVEMVLAWFYPGRYAERRLDASGGWLSRDEVAAAVTERMLCGSFEQQDLASHLLIRRLESPGPSGGDAEGSPREAAARRKAPDRKRAGRGKRRRGSRVRRAGNR